MGRYKLIYHSLGIRTLNYVTLGMQKSKPLPNRSKQSINNFIKRRVNCCWIVATQKLVFNTMSFDPGDHNISFCSLVMSFASNRRGLTGTDTSLSVSKLHDSIVRIVRENRKNSL